jgi:hypothetical protein
MRAKTLLRLGVSTLLASSLGGGPLLAANFEQVNSTAGGPSSSGKPAAPPTIRMTGVIDDGDASRLRLMLIEIRKGKTRAPEAALATIELTSQGGDMLEGMKLGYLFREFDVATVVRAGDACLSSCALAFLGGTRRHVAADATVSRTVEVGGTLGFHNFSLNPGNAASDATSGREGVTKGFNQARGAASLLIRYAGALGVEPEFIASMLGRPPEVWDYANTAGKIIDLRICPIGLKIAVPTPELRAVNICNNILGDSAARDTPSAARSVPPAEAKRYLLNHIRQNMASLDVRGPLATQLAAAATARDDKTVEAAYADLRAAGLALPELVGPIFEIKGFNAGEYALECLVSFAADDLDRFSVALKTPSGLLRPESRGAPACARALSFEKGAILNPENK